MFGSAEASPSLSEHTPADMTNGKQVAKLFVPRQLASKSLTLECAGFLCEALKVKKGKCLGQGGQRSWSLWFKSLVTVGCR
ncbi:MAG: hypothetical protein LASZOEIN_001398 [Candidatus Fervidibacter sp.]|jgi:hypothetical protein